MNDGGGQNSRAGQACTIQSSNNAAKALSHLETSSFEDLASAMCKRLTADRETAARQIQEVQTAQRNLEEKQRFLDETEKRIFEIDDGADEIVELNVGGQLMSTRRSVLCSAECSLLAGMFSGKFDKNHKRDKDNRIFIDVDPPLFAKLLSHLRLRQIASPDCPAPLPHVPDDMRPEYEMVVKFFGLETFMYGDAGASSNIFQRIAELTNVPQAKLQSHDVLRLMLSSTGGVPATHHEEVLGAHGFHERSLENSYGALPNIITIRFQQHRIRVEAMELRAKTSDIVAHMSHQWEFRHGSETIKMSFNFSPVQRHTGRLETPRLGPAFVNEVAWKFPKDFCLEHIVLHGRVLVEARN